MEVGEVVAKSVVNYFSSDTSKQIVEQFRTAGVSLDEPNTDLPPIFENKSIVVTGKVPGMGRE